MSGQIQCFLCDLPLPETPQPVSAIAVFRQDCGARELAAAVQLMPHFPPHSSLEALGSAKGEGDDTHSARYTTWRERSKGWRSCGDRLILAHIALADNASGGHLFASLRFEVVIARCLTNLRPDAKNWRVTGL
ncbi:MAG: hypothetical protein R2839_02450 [Thermomicrobiales bacterium]